MFSDLTSLFDNPVHLILITATIVFCLWLGWKLRQLWKRFSFWRQRRRGLRGEARAKKLLKRHGYRIIDSQLTIPGQIHIDDEPCSFDVRPDYLVERKGIQYLAEVKTGEAASPNDRNTRRQLFEYAALADSDTVILVDATEGTVTTVRFGEYD